MNRFDAVFFDLGDTLFYFDDNWNEVFAEARQAMLSCLQEEGLALEQDFSDEFLDRMQTYYRERDTDFIEHTMHHVLCEALTDRGLGETPDVILQHALKKFHDITQAHWVLESDALPTLNRLRKMGYRLALISNGADDANTQFLIDKAGIRPLVETVSSSAAEGIRKPNPKIFIRTLQRMQLSADRVVMVGDTLGADILGAQNSGIFAIWITRRADTPANRAHADTIIPDAQIHTLSELPYLILRLEQEMPKPPR